MAFTSYTDYIANRRNKPRVNLAGQHRAEANTSPQFANAFIDNGGTAPTTGVICDKTTVGAANLGMWSDSGTILLTELLLGCPALITPSALLLIDRLSHQAGLSGTTTGAQTTNLPTAALTRYTSGVGVHIGLQIYTSVGTTATTLTCSYTNTAGTNGRTSEVIPFGGNIFNNSPRCFIPLPLQVGDTGVKSVESVTLAASTVSAAGNFGIVLYKPLLSMQMTRDYWSSASVGGNDWSWEALFNGCAYMPQITQDACLDILAQGGGTAANPIGGTFGMARV